MYVGQLMQMHFTLFSGVIGTFILSHLLGTPAFRQARTGNAAQRLHLEVKSGKVVQGCVPIAPLMTCLVGLITNKCFADEIRGEHAANTPKGQCFRYRTRYGWKKLQTSPQTKGNRHIAWRVLTPATNTYTSPLEALVRQTAGGHVYGSGSSLLLIAIKTLTFVCKQGTE